MLSHIRSIKPLALSSLLLAPLISGNCLAAETKKHVANPQLSEEYLEKFQEVGSDLNHVSKAGASYALKSLSETGKLQPFALILNMDGTLGKIQPELPYIKNSPLPEKIGFLRGQIKGLAENKKIKAGALFSRGFGRTADKSRELLGLIVEQEHLQGPSTIQFVPYEQKPDGIYVALESTSKPKPRLFFNDKISSEETYKEIKELSAQAKQKN